MDFMDLMDCMDKGVKENLMGLVRSSARADWATPVKWFEYLDLEFKFTLDVCASERTKTCERWFGPGSPYGEDGLRMTWMLERVFMNPPYGREIGQWMEKAFKECWRGYALVVCLVPARVETRWWHEWASKGEVRFPMGRLQFDECGVNAPFPVAIVIFRPRLGTNQNLLTSIPTEVLE